jgi:PST family polysaccharide transporter
VVRRAVLRQAGGLYLMQGLGNLMGVATIALLARRLGPEAYGTLAFAQGLLNYMAYLVNYGLDLSASREASRRKDAGELSALVAEVLLMRGLLLALSLALLPLVSWPLPREAREALLPLSGLLLGQALSPYWLLLGTGRPLLGQGVELAQRLLTLLLLLFLVGGPEDLRLAGLAIGAGAFLASGMGLLGTLLHLRLRPRLPKMSRAWEALRWGWWLFLSQAGGVLLTGGNPFFLGLFAPPAEVGRYAAAEKIALTALALVQPLFRALYPRFTGSPPGSEGLRTLGRKSLILFGGLGATLGLLLALSSGALLELVYGETYREAASVLAIMALGLPPHFLAILWGGLGLLSLGRDRIYTLNLFLAGTLQVLLILLLSPAHGALGAAWAGVAGAWSLAALQGVALARAGVHPVFWRR